MNSPADWLEFPIVHQIGRALLHSLWEGLAVAALLWVALAVLRSRSAGARYSAACAALLMTAALPVITFLLLPATAPTSRAVISDQRRGGNLASAVQPIAATADADSRATRTAGRPPLRDVESTRTTMSPLRANDAPAVLADLSSRVQATIWQRTSGLASRAAPWLVLGWIAGVLALSFWNVGAWASTQRLKSARTRPVARRIETTAATLARRLGLARAVGILQSALIDSPLVIGWLKPVILLPASMLTDLPVAHLEALLAHELAHVRRHDYLINLLQAIIETLLFYHPAIWWVSARIRDERENCCDDLAIAVTRDRTAYVRALARVAGALPPALAPAASGGELLPRLQRLLDKPDSEAGRSRWLAGTLLIGACAILFIAARNVTAQNGAQIPISPATQPVGKNVLKVIVTVVDDANAKPIPKFTVSHGWESPGFPMFWEPSTPGRAIQGEDGRFEIDENVDRAGYAIRIEADGYMPARSKVFHRGVGTVRLDFRLQKSIDLEGTLLSTDGMPLAQAQVLVVTSGSRIQLSDGQLRNTSALDTTADSEGHFSLMSQSGKFLLMVVHERGFALLSAAQLAASHRYVIQPWGNIDGTASIGTTRAAGRQIIAYTHIPKEGTTTDAYDRDFLQVEMINQAKADANGHFVLSHMPSGRANVGIVVQWGGPNNETIRGQTQNTHVNLEAGKTASITLGGKGRPVIGRVVAPPALIGQVSWSRGFFFARPQLQFPRRALPPDWATMIPEQRAKWNQQWRDSPEVQAYEKQMSNERFFPVEVRPDGTFRIDDMEAGSYTLVIQAYAPFGPNVPIQTIAAASQEFTVPRMPTGRSDEPMDVGAIGLAIPVGARTGESAPALSAKTVDGQPLSLADYRGKFALVEFWATWCKPCVAELPYLKATYDAFSNDPRFAMIGLSVDEKAEAPRQFAINQGLKWTQGSLGGWSATDIPNQWGVHGIPSVFLIGPDGKVLAAGLRGDDIRARVAQALAAAPSKP